MNNFSLCLSQLNYDENSKMIGAQIQQYLLEVNRISDLKEKKFHVFYALIHGGPDDILKVRIDNCNRLFRKIINILLTTIFSTYRIM